MNDTAKVPSIGTPSSARTALGVMATAASTSAPSTEFRSRLMMFSFAKPALLRAERARSALNKAGFAKENIMSLLRNSVLGALVLAAVAITPKAVLADEGVPIDGTFAVSFMRPAAPSAVTGPYCASGGTPIEAQGIGSVS